MATRSVIGAAAQQVQGSLISAYQSAYPAVTQHAALEISLYDPHVNGFGGAQAIPEYGSASINPGRNETMTRSLISAVHAGGGQPAEREDPRPDRDRRLGLEV